MFILSLVICLSFWYFYEDFIESCTKKLVDQKMSEKITKYDIEYYYNNPQIRYHLIFKPNSYVRKKYNNQTLKSDYLSELITEEEFLKQVENDSTLAEIIYKSIHFLTNLKVLMIVQLIRLAFFIWFLISFYLFLKEFIKDWYHIVYIITVFFVSIILAYSFINWCLTSKKSYDDHHTDSVNENLKIISVERNKSNSKR